MRKIPKTAQQKRNKKIASMAFREGGYSYAEIGKKFGISPQRVEQIAKREMFRGAGKCIGVFAEEQIKLTANRALKECDTVECYHIALAMIISYLEK